jgi:hypothetical protein
MPSSQQEGQALQRGLFSWELVACCVSAAKSGGCGGARGFCSLVRSQHRAPANPFGRAWGSGGGGGRPEQI